jgi:hypothetical protein
MTLTASGAGRQSPRRPTCPIPTGVGHVLGRIIPVPARRQDRSGKPLSSGPSSRIRIRSACDGRVSRTRFLVERRSFERDAGRPRPADQPDAVLTGPPVSSSAIRRDDSTSPARSPTPIHRTGRPDATKQLPFGSRFVGRRNSCPTRRRRLARRPEPRLLRGRSRPGGAWPPRRQGS